jgi:hypothetical protein
MITPPAISLYKRHRFPAEILSHCVWLYCRFSLSYRDVQEMMAARGVVVSHEAVRYWGHTCGQGYANQPRRRHPFALHRDAGADGTLHQSTPCTATVVGPHAPRRPWPRYPKRLGGLIVGGDKGRKQCLGSAIPRTAARRIFQPAHGRLTGQVLTDNRHVLTRRLEGRIAPEAGAIVGLCRATSNLNIP